jgi:hypothetical protein
VASERCKSCDHEMTSHCEHGCLRKIKETRDGITGCPCTAVPPKPRCRAMEGATGIDCALEVGHPGEHEGTHMPHTDGTESVGYPLFVRWPYTDYDHSTGIRPQSTPARSAREGSPDGE